MAKIRVVIVEDHDLSRIGLRASLEQSDLIEVVGDAPNGNKGLQLLQLKQPDVAIVDIGLPDIDGIEVTQRYKKSIQSLPTADEGATNSPKVLILSMHNSEDSVLAAFAAGADSYALKDVSLDNLIQAVQQTHQGNAWIDPAIARIVLQQSKKLLPVVADLSGSGGTVVETTEITAIDPEVQGIIEAYPLTERELEVLELIVSGCNNADIAERLYITVGTVKTHVRNILNKLCANDRTQAAVRALRAGLVP